MKTLNTVLIFFVSITLLNACQSIGGPNSDLQPGPSGSPIPSPIPSTTQSPTPNPSATAAGADLATCPAGPLLSQFPFDTQYLHQIWPLGTLNPPGHTLPTDHLYVHSANPSNQPVTLNMVFPGDATVMSVTAQINGQGYDPNNVVDYTIHFRPCKEVEVYFNHVQLTADFLSKYPSFSTGICNVEDVNGNGTVYLTTCSLLNEFPVHAGDVFGYLTIPANTNNGPGMDFGAEDGRLPLPTAANPNRLLSGFFNIDEAHVACPLDLFNTNDGNGNPLKNMLYSYLGDIDVHGNLIPRTVAPLCGTIYQDDIGTAQGSWFPTAASDTLEDISGTSAVAWVHDNFDPTRPVLSVGDASNAADAPYYYVLETSGPINSDPSTVLPGSGMHCLEHLTDRWFNANLIGKVILIELTADNTLIVEAQAASDCVSATWVFSGAATTFYR